MWTSHPSPRPCRPATARDTALEAAIAEGDPSATRLQIGAPLGDSPAQSGERLLIATLAELGKPDSLGSTFTGNPDTLAAAMAAAAGLKDLLVDQLVVIADVTVKLGIEVDGRDVLSTLPHRVLYDVSNGGTYLVLLGRQRVG